MQWNMQRGRNGNMFALSIFGEEEMKQDLYRCDDCGIIGVKTHFASITAHPRKVVLCWHCWQGPEDKTQMRMSDY